MTQVVLCSGAIAGRQNGSLLLSVLFILEMKNIAYICVYIT